MQSRLRVDLIKMTPCYGLAGSIDHQQTIDKAEIVIFCAITMHNGETFERVSKTLVKG
jgi:hypothetical protein